MGCDLGTGLFVVCRCFCVWCSLCCFRGVCCVNLGGFRGVNSGGFRGVNFGGFGWIFCFRDDFVADRG